MKYTLKKNSKKFLFKNNELDVSAVDTRRVLCCTLNSNSYNTIIYVSGMFTVSAIM